VEDESAIEELGKQVRRFIVSRSLNPDGRRITNSGGVPMNKRWWTVAAVVSLAFMPSGLHGQELAKPVRLEAGGQPINIGGVGHSAPFLADFYGDGKLHLLVGTFSDGQLRIYRNISTNKAPKFDAKFDLLLDGRPEGTVPTG
jgi:hypothetical protein